MANSSYTATGVLVLDNVTPVITALFGDFKWEETQPSSGELYIAKTDSYDPSWDNVLHGFMKLV